MKFTIAAGILVAQSLPVVSDDGAAPLAADVLGSNHHHKNDLVVVAPQEIPSHGLLLPKLHGFLKNHQKGHIASSSRTETNCDPSSDAPDVGVLSCGLGYECVPHEASTLGGICVSRTSREIQEDQEVISCYLCDYGQLVGYAQYSLPSGYQDFTCGDLALAAYGEQVTLTADQCKDSPSFVQSAGCCVSYDCNPCSADKMFNASALLDDKELTCGEITPVMNETVCAFNAPSLAPLCCVDAAGGGGDMTPTAAPGVNTPTSVVSGIPTAVPDVPTPTTTAAEVPTSVVPTISPMAELTTDIPTAAVPVDTPTTTSAASDTPTTAVVPDTPTTTAAPDTPTTEVPDTPEVPATPDSATMWSTNIFVSAVGLVAAAGGGLLWLN